VVSGLVPSEVSLPGFLLLCPCPMLPSLCTGGQKAQTPLSIPIMTAALLDQDHPIPSFNLIHLSKSLCSKHGHSVGEASSYRFKGEQN
jgi:hypothetical protein